MPNRSIEEFKKFLEELGRSVKRRDNRKKIIVTGDFNSKNVVWRSRSNDRRGIAWMATEGLAVLNDGEAPTCEHGGYPSHIDITLVNNVAAAFTAGWRVLDEEESGSDHHYIFFQVEQTRPQEGTQRKTRRWQARKLDLPILRRELDRKCEQIMVSETGTGGIQTEAQQFSQLMIVACTKADRQPPIDRRHHRPKHWWNKEIANLRKICVRKRRTYTRTRSWQRRRNNLQPETDQRATQQLREYQEARNKLRQRIRHNKGKSWKKTHRNSFRTPLSNSNGQNKEKITTNPPRHSDESDKEPISYATKEG